MQINHKKALHFSCKFLFLQKRKKRAWEDMNFVKPDPLKKQYERSLQKIATR